MRLPWAVVGIISLISIVSVYNLFYRWLNFPVAQILSGGKIPKPVLLTIILSQEEPIERDRLEKKVEGVSFWKLRILTKGFIQTNICEPFPCISTHQRSYSKVLLPATSTQLNWSVCGPCSANKSQHVGEEQIQRMGILVLKNGNWWKPHKGEYIKLSSSRVLEKRDW